MNQEMPTNPPDEGGISEKKKKRAALNKVVHQIAQKLGETEKNPIRQIGIIVRHFGAEAALALVAEVQAIEAQGGMMITNGQRRRTPGGVFFYLAKERMTPEDRERLMPSRYARIKQYKAKLREQEQEENANLPPFVWEARQAAIEPLRAEQGEARDVKITLVGRPGKVEPFREMVVTAMSHTAKSPTLPRGVPSPPETPTVYTVYMSSRHWNKVQQSIETDPEDTLIIEGLCAYDDAVGAVAVYATSVTTKKLEAAKRQAQKRAAEAAGGAPAGHKSAAPQKPAPKKEKEKARPEPPAPAASSANLPPTADSMPPADAQKLRELYASAALFRQKIKTIEAKPEGQRFGLEMTRKLLQNVEADIAALERKHRG